MRLRDIMSEDVEVVAATATVDQAREAMRQHDIGHAVVVDGEAIVGVVSAHDLRRAGGTSGVRAAMSAPVVTAPPQATLRQAANLMRGNHVSCLPILDEGKRLIGIVTIADLLDLIGKGVTRERVDENRKPASYLPGR